MNELKIDSKIFQIILINKRLFKPLIAINKIIEISEFYNDILQ